MTIDPAPTNADSALFSPLLINNGNIRLAHRVILAPLTRNRGTPLKSEGTAEDPNRVWLPNEMMVEYYSQRASKGGLVVTEGVPPSLEWSNNGIELDRRYGRFVVLRGLRRWSIFLVDVESHPYEGNAMPGVPGLFLPSQIPGWKAIASAIHAKGGVAYMQIWHSGRANIPHMTGTPICSASATPWDDAEECFMFPPPHTTQLVRYSDFPPEEMSIEHIKKTIQDYVRTAKWAVEECGFDGVEVHGGNGYLVEQFLASNVNKRTDAYGGTYEKRCAFALELMSEISRAIGEERLAIRLTPFGLFNQIRSEQRLETWQTLCRRLKEAHPGLSYVSFVEPRYEQLHSEKEKQTFLDSWGLGAVDLTSFRKIFGATPFFAAGNYNDINSWDVVESKRYDGLLYGRYFISNPDLPKRLKESLPLQPYDRSTFYGPFEDPCGYVDYSAWEDAAAN